jgi:hypothetical protein
MIIRRRDIQPVASAHGVHVHKELLLRGVGPGDLFVVPPGAQHSQKTQTDSHTVLYWGLATG